MNSLYQQRKFRKRARSCRDMYRSKNLLRTWGSWEGGWIGSLKQVGKEDKER